MKNKTKMIVILSIFFVLVVAFAITWSQARARFAVERLEIEGLPYTVECGQQIQLEAVGYYEDGSVVPPEVMDLLGLRWTAHPDIFKSEIDQDGLLTVTSEHDCNVQVYSKWLGLTSRPVTVRVTPAE